MAEAPPSPSYPVPHSGMPPLDMEGKPLSFYEFWPMQAFYFPLFVYVAWLSIRYRGLMLPTCANPSFPGGGFYGESKAEILALLMRHIPEWTAPFIRVQRPQTSSDPQAEMAQAIQSLVSVGISLPVVAKPDLGCRGAGVRLIAGDAELVDYIANFPPGAGIILQRYVKYEGEAGIFYVRRPHETRGRIISLTLKYFPYVIGDGAASLEELILRDPRAREVPHLYLARHRARLSWVPAIGEPVRLAFAGSHSRGAIFRDGTPLVTDAMTERFDQISQALPEFYFGRFDVRFADFDDLRRGEGFTIVELNGAGAESTHIWDRRTPLLRAWGALIEQYHLLYEIGAANRRRGHHPLRIREFLDLYQKEQTLTALYPPTQ